MTLSEQLEAVDKLRASISNMHVLLGKADQRIQELEEANNDYRNEVAGVRFELDKTAGELKMLKAKLTQLGGT